MADGCGRRRYALSLIDTVQVGKDGAKVLADGLKGKDDVMFYMEVSLVVSSRAVVQCSHRLNPQEDEKKPSKAAQADGPSRRNAAPTAVVKSKLRNENREIDADAMNRRKQHQRELAQRRQEDGMAKYSGEGGKGDNNREKQWRRFESYVKDSQLPDSVANQKVGLSSSASQDESHRLTSALLPRLLSTRAAARSSCRSMATPCRSTSTRSRA